MEQKNEVSITSSSEASKKIRGQTMFGFDFCDLPFDMKLEIGSSLEPTMQTSLALTSKKNFHLFKSNFKAELVNTLLTRITMGEQYATERLLKISPELMLEKTTFTDRMDRTFSNISAFEWVLWGWDTRYMVNMMLNCLPNDDKGSKLVTELKKQYACHQKNGITYILDGKTINEKHFDFSVLIDALKTYKASRDSWALPECKKYWCTVIGNAQRFLPVHIMQHYCDPTIPFYPPPKFDAKQFVRILSFSNYINNKDLMTWEEIMQSDGQVVGVNLGVARHCAGHAVTASWFHSGVAQCDHDALSALFEKRKSDYILIPFHLESLLLNHVAEKKCEAVRHIHL